MPPTVPGNRLLAALPPADLDRLLPRMSEVTFEHKETVYRLGGPIDFVYFPHTGVLSAVVLMSDGQTAEAAAIGCWGMTGVTAFLGATVSSEMVFCQVPPARCWKMSAVDFSAEVARGAAFQKVIHAYSHAFLAASARSTACNCLHSVDERCARWLLTCHDQVGGDEFSLTHEFLATMLGVRRATVTVSASSLQAARIITYRHGRVKILDRAGLEKASCECYRAIRSLLVP